jgi:hypothetical protein
MIVYQVVKEQHGWSVRMDQHMTTPFWSRDLAIREANRLAEAIGRHGERTEVIVEGGSPQIASVRLEPSSSRARYRPRPKRRSASLPAHA